MLKTTIADLHRRHSWDRATSVKAELKNVPSVGLTTNSCNTKTSEPTRLEPCDLTRIHRNPLRLPFRHIGGFNG
jgi:hypothetical protein